MERSLHPYSEYIPQNAGKLIVGTIPPRRFCVPEGVLYPNDVDFYYGSKDNAFWRIMSEVTGASMLFENTAGAIDQRKELLDSLGIGVTDIVAECIHRNGRSDDGSLEIIALKPLGALLQSHPMIAELIYTSRFVARQVNLLSDKHRHSWSPGDPRRGYVAINRREYPVTVLYSPSPNALRGVSKGKRLEQYRAVFTCPETPGRL